MSEWLAFEQLKMTLAEVPSDYILSFSQNRRFQHFLSTFLATARPQSISHGPKRYPKLCLERGHLAGTRGHAWQAV